MRKFLLIAASLITIGMPTITQAGPASGAGNNARDYIPAPAGTAAMITYWKHISGNEFYAGQEKVSDNVGVSADVFILRPVYWTQIGSLVFDPQLLIVGEDQQVDAGAGGAAATGLADPVAVASFWVVNQPENKFWVALSPFFSIPIGEYHKSHPENSVGANRWTVRPEIGLVKGLGDKFYLDLTASAEWFQKNSDYADKELEQAMQYHLESHLSYDFSKSFFGAVDYYGYFGGETELDGRKQDDRKNNHTLGLTGSYGVAPGYQVMLQYKDDVSVKDGLKANTFMARFLHVW